MLNRYELLQFRLDSTFFHKKDLLFVINRVTKEFVQLL